MSMAAARSSQVPRPPRRANNAWLPLPADLASCASMRHAPEGRDCEKGCWRWVVKGGVGTETWAKAADAVAATAAARRQVAGVNSSSLALALAASDAEAGAMPLSAPVAGVSVGDADGTAVGVARALSCATAALTAAAEASHAINGVTTVTTAEAAVTVMVVAVPVAAAGVGPGAGLGGWPLLAVAPGVCVPFAASSTAAAAGGSADVDCETNRRSNWLPDAVCVFSVSAPGATAPTVDGSTTGARTAAEARVRTYGAEYDAARACFCTSRDGTTCATTPT